MRAAILWVPLFFLLVFGLLYGMRGFHEARVRRRLRREGIETKAVVVGHWVMGTPRLGNTYYVSYGYYHEGHRYQREEQVASSRYKVWPRGTQISVRYLPQNPYVVRISGEENHFLHSAFVILALIIIVLVLAWVLS